MSKMGIRHFLSDGLATIVELGYVPDMCKVHLDEGTNPDIVTWFKRMFDDEGIYGFLLTGSSGVITRLTTAATGISAYDTATLKAMLPAPNGSGNEASATLPLEWTTARSSAASARSVTVTGTLIKPTSGNETGLIYECTTDGTGSGTEPTWPTRPGESVTDNSTVWIARNLKVKMIGVKGIQIGADVSQNTNGNQIYIEAYGADKDPADLDAGDVAAGEPI